MSFRSGISRSCCDYAGLLSRFGTLRCAGAAFKTRTEADLDRVFLTDERSKRPVLPGPDRVIGAKDMIRLWLRIGYQAVRLGRRLVLAQPLRDDSVDTRWTPLAMNETPPIGGVLLFH
jgi:hypothetical protein